MISHDDSCYHCPFPSATLAPAGMVGSPDRGAKEKESDGDVIDSTHARGTAKDSPSY